MWEITATALDILQPHPSLPGLDTASSFCGCLLPVVASELIIAGKAGWATALVSGRLRLHPSLAGLSGGIAFLEKFLKDCSNTGWEASQIQALKVDSTGLAYAAPQALSAAASRMSNVMKKALHVLNSDSY